MYKFRCIIFLLIYNFSRSEYVASSNSPFFRRTNLQIFKQNVIPKFSNSTLTNLYISTELSINVFK